MSGADPGSEQACTRRCDRSIRRIALRRWRVRRVRVVRRGLRRPSGTAAGTPGVVARVGSPGAIDSGGWVAGADAFAEASVVGCWGSRCRRCGLFDLPAQAGHAGSSSIPALRRFSIQRSVTGAESSPSPGKRSSRDSCEHANRKAKSEYCSLSKIASGRSRRILARRGSWESRSRRSERPLVRIAHRCCGVRLRYSCSIDCGARAAPSHAFAARSRGDVPAQRVHGTSFP